MCRDSIWWWKHRKKNPTQCASILKEDKEGKLKGTDELGDDSYILIKNKKKEYLPFKRIPYRFLLWGTSLHSKYYSIYKKKKKKKKLGNSYVPNQDLLWQGTPCMCESRPPIWVDLLEFWVDFSEWQKQQRQVLEHMKHRVLLTIKKHLNKSFGSIKGSENV